MNIQVFRMLLNVHKRKNGDWLLILRWPFLRKKDLEPCVFPEDRNDIPNEYIFKRKLDAAGKVCRYKARLVCTGFMQRQGVDYSETFATVAQFVSMTWLIAIAAFHKFRVVQLSGIVARKLLGRFGMQECKPIKTPTAMFSGRFAG